ncbi:MAG TPA: isoprenylcysteine carboxylmethyltransferase family protein [Bryobacteraceae bacterium]|nr:isoprenylcysteine carboxylmethyltransferase family protein [Bryobacteraceae bacterium]
MNQSAAPRYLFPKPYADFVQRLRVAGGFALLLALAFLAHPSLRSLALGLPVSVIGLLLRGWAAGHLAKDRELATSGPYSFLRNPLYVGTATVAFGIVLAARNLWLTILFAAVFLLVYLPAIELEEQHLREIFGDYASYAEQVHRFLPLRRHTLRPHPFSWALYRKNEEWKAFLGWLAAAAWLSWRARLL